MSAPAPRAAADASPDADFASLLADAASVIAETMAPWRVRLGEAAARWRAEGVRTAVLERALARADDPGVDALLDTFARTVARLRALERDAAAADPALAGAPFFRDPERLREAAAATRAARALAPADPPPSATGLLRPTPVLAMAAIAAPPAAAEPAAAAVPNAARGGPAVRPDAERWLLVWPSADGLLLGDAA